MADWGAGWANAARGVSDAFNMYAGAKMNERERIAEEARRLKEAKRQELQELRKMQFQREMANEDRMFRAKTTKQAQAFEAEQAAAQRGLTQGYYNQMAASDRERLALQREEMAQRERMAGMGLANRGGESAGPTANRVDTALMQEFALIRESGDEEAKIAAGTIYSSNASPEEKLQRLRAIIGRMTQPSGLTGIR